MRSVEKQTKTTTTTTVQKQFQNSDATIPFRFVGSYEYANALDSFTQLINLSTPEELEVYDKVLKKRPEFTFFNGANTAFVEQPEMRIANPFDRKKFSDQFLQKGMGWMMGLARIELGATLSMYGNDPTPFQTISDNDYDVVPYLQILHDDVVAHMASLSQEADFEEVVRRSRKIDTWTLAYLRRIKLIRDMLSTLAVVGDEAFQAEIAPLDKELKKYEKRLLTQINTQTQKQSSQSSTTKVGKGNTSQLMKVSNKAITDCEDIVKKSDPGGNTGGAYPRLTVSR